MVRRTWLSFRSLRVSHIDQWVIDNGARTYTAKGNIFSNPEKAAEDCWPRWTPHQQPFLDWKGNPPESPRSLKYFLIHFQNFYKLNFNFETGFSGISYYSATQTSDAVYIIGGYFTSNIVAEFKNDQWRRLANLNQGRYAHGSITIGGQTMIIGGGSRYVTYLMSF